MMNEMTNTPVAIASDRANIAIIVDSAPESYRNNQASRDNCLAACRKLLDEITLNGMTDELDQKAALYIEKTRKTVKAMNERRAPVTKLFDQIRTEFTGMENAIDPAKSGTIPYRLQQERNAYAARKREEEERRRQEEAARIARQQARASYRTACEEDFRKSFNNLVDKTINEMTELNSRVTLESYRSVSDTLQGYSASLPEGWCPPSSVRLPVNLTADECGILRKETWESLVKRFEEQYSVEIGDYRRELLERLPSKKAELERMALANAEEQARIAAQMKAREEAEARRKEEERVAREKEEAARKQMEKQNVEMAGLFAQACVGADYQPKAKVTKRMVFLSSEAFLQVLTMWWTKEGVNLPIDELARIFKKQVTFCEKLANKEEVFIKDANIQYVDEVKAK